VAKHVRSALILGHARGVALLAARLSGADVHEYTPTQIKLGVTGSGRAPKEQVQGMILQLLGLHELPAEDAADALAAALCHALRKPIIEL
jgi:crossover junction endodeoxyribonuclease RuvC